MLNRPIDPASLGGATLAKGPLAEDVPATPVPSSATTLSRRRFLQGTAGGSAALLIGLQLPENARAQPSGAAAAIVSEGGGDDASFAPNAFVRIADDDTVTVLIKHLEMGQGPYTGLATLVAEELDADWSQMRAEAAPANLELYANKLFGIQGTGGSTAIASSWEQMRLAGAAARAMLVAAAAKSWGVDAAEITIDSGRIAHPSGKSSGFGAMAAFAADEAVPEAPALKDPKDFRLIGTELPKLDTGAKSTGRASYAMDVYRDGMLTVLVRHAPKFGATVASFDAAATLKVPGVVDVRQIPQGIAVYAKNTFAAMKGRNALTIDWDESAAETRSTDAMLAEYRDKARERGIEVETRGDAAGMAGAGGRDFEAEYLFPYLAHAPMEPLDGVIERVKSDGGEEGVVAWLGCQMQTIDQGTLAAVLEVPPERVVIHTMFAGGSFGRRAQAGGDFAAELAAVAKARDAREPLKLLWTREDDIRGGRYRPLTVHRLAGSVDANGDITHWEDTVVTQSIMAGGPFEQMVENGVDPTSVEGSRGLPYAIPNFHVSLHTAEAGVPVLWWRSVGHTHTAYATETFVDELLEAGGKDALEGRRALVGADPRYVGVLDAVEKLSDWGSDVPAGRSRGVALHKSFNTYAAEVVEVSEGDDGMPKVHKVWCAIDCGIAVNPNVIRAQVEGGIGYALGAMLHDEITLEEGGAIRQSNFHDYRSLRIHEMPQVEVAIVTSAEPPTGIGEPGVPPLAPAVANAWRRLNGTAIRQLPVVKGVQA